MSFLVLYMTLLKSLEIFGRHFSFRFHAVCLAGTKTKIRCHFVTFFDEMNTSDILLQMTKIIIIYTNVDGLCGLVVRVSGYRYRGPGFDPRR